MCKKDDGLDFGDTPRDLYDNNLSYVDRAFQRFVEWLKQKGHSAEEIVKILAKVKQYDREMNVDSVMDSIAGGSFNLQAIIDEALG